MTLSPGTRLGRYEIRSMIGAGGMGEVYRAHDAKLQREVAVKILPANVSQDPARLQRFELEAHAASRLNHPNILSIFDVGLHDGISFIVSELLCSKGRRCGHACSEARSLAARWLISRPRSRAPWPPLTTAASSTAT